MEYLEIISLVCTFGVVACGLTVIVAATVRVIRDILKTHGGSRSGLESLVPAPMVWETRTETVESPRRARRRLKTTGHACPHCGGDIADAQIISSETTDDKTVLTKECPSCKKEVKVDA